MIGGVESFYQVEEGNKGWQVLLSAEMKQGLQYERPVLAAHFRGSTKLCVDAVLPWKAVESLVQNAAEFFEQTSMRLIPHHLLGR